jgi:vacuolar-type H+-ATPase subunit H
MATLSSADAAVEAAISRVLDAERAAHDDVDHATRDAAAMVEEARGTARAIAERTERRIRTLREAFETHVAHEVAAIDAQALAQDERRELARDDLDRLDRAVVALANELTGGTA